MTDQSRGADTRKTILETSHELISKNGYDATSVAQICQGAQVSKGAFYHHFASKQALFLALMDAWLADIQGMIEVAGETAETVPEALEQMAVITGGLFDALEGGFPILLEFWTQASRQPCVWDQAVAPYRQYLEYFTGLMQAGIDEGSFDAVNDPEVMARGLTSLVMGLMLQAAFDPAGAQWQAVTRQAILMFVNGIRSRS